MNRDSAEILHLLFKNGCIDRSEEPDLWHSYYDEAEIQNDLQTLADGMKLEIVPVSGSGRIYMLPAYDNDFFLKNNSDYRQDIGGANEAKIADLYLLNYAAMYLLYLFFRGEGSDILCRDFIERGQFLEELNNHFESFFNGRLGEEAALSIDENFKNVAEAWRAKAEGEPDSRRLSEKNGVISRLLIKLKADELFTVSPEGKIEPTRKLKDLMPYFLSKERLIIINSYLEEADSHAAAQ